MKTLLTALALSTTIAQAELFEIRLEGNSIDLADAIVGGTIDGSKLLAPEEGNPWFSDLTGDGVSDLTLSPATFQNDGAFSLVEITINSTELNSSFDMGVIFNSGFESESDDVTTAILTASFTPPGNNAPVSGLLEVTTGGDSVRRITLTRLLWDSEAIISEIPATSPTLFGTTTSTGFTRAPLVVPGLVTSSADSGPGSLRQTIADASEGDTITFAVPEVILASPLHVDKPLTIDGSAYAQNTTIRRPSDAPQFGLISTIGGTDFRHLTLTGGAGGAGGAISTSGGNTSITLQSCLLHNNRATGTGGAIYAFNNAIILDRTSVIYNTGGNGGGIAAVGSAISATNSTLSHNTATFTGGGLQLDDTSTLSLTHCSILDNTCGNARGGAAGNSKNTASATVTLRNCLFGRNLAIGNIDGFATPDNSSVFVVSGTTTINGAPSATGILPIIDPLAPLAGGETRFSPPNFAHQILPTATDVIDKATPDFGLPTDQRGYPRITTASSINGDIGAIEYQKDRLRFWRLENFGPVAVADETLRNSLWGLSADPDRDGITNFTEFLIVGNPNRSEGSLTSVSLVEFEGSTYPAITYRENIDLTEIGIFIILQQYDPVAGTWSEIPSEIFSAFSNGGPPSITLRSTTPVSPTTPTALLRLATP